jgi:hypothetical protein
MTTTKKYGAVFPSSLDVRVTKRFLRTGMVSADVISQHLASLPDVASKGQSLGTATQTNVVNDSSLDFGKVDREKPYDDSEDDGDNE